MTVEIQSIEKVHIEKGDVLVIVLTKGVSTRERDTAMGYIGEYIERQGGRVFFTNPDDPIELYKR
jgi:hypothetical protein